MAVPWGWERDASTFIRTNGPAQGRGHKFSKDLSFSQRTRPGRPPVPRALKYVITAFRLDRSPTRRQNFGLCIFCVSLGCYFPCNSEPQRSQPIQNFRKGDLHASIPASIPQTSHPCLEVSSPSVFSYSVQRRLAVRSRPQAIMLSASIQLPLQRAISAATAMNRPWPSPMVASKTVESVLFRQRRWNLWQSRAI